MNIRFYVDEYGVLRADTDPQYTLLSWYLEGDIQSSDMDCLELLRLVNDVKGGKIPEWSGTGNAHTLTLTPGKARIENEFTDELPPLELPLSEFRQVLHGWLDFIRKVRPTA